MGASVSKNEQPASVRGLRDILSAINDDPEQRRKFFRDAQDRVPAMFASDYQTADVVARLRTEYDSTVNNLEAATGVAIKTDATLRRAIDVDAQKRIGEKFKQLYDSPGIDMTDDSRTDIKTLFEYFLLLRKRHTFLQTKYISLNLFMIQFVPRVSKLLAAYIKDVTAYYRTRSEYQRIVLSSLFKLMSDMSQVSYIEGIEDIDNRMRSIMSRASSSIEEEQKEIAHLASQVSKQSFEDMMRLFSESDGVFRDSLLTAYRNNLTTTERIGEGIRDTANFVTDIPNKVLDGVGHLALKAAPVLSDATRAVSNKIERVTGMAERRAAENRPAPIRYGGGSVA
jgi:hypothetical protein